MNKQILWDFNAVSKEALKYTKRVDFKNNSAGAYQAACKNKWLNAVCTHMNGRRRWCESSVIAEAKKYDTKKEFKSQCQSAYNAANRLGILSEACSHMKELIKFWTKTEVIDVAKQYETRNDFKKFDEKAYQAAHHNGWIDDACSHMVEPTGGRLSKWDFDSVKSEALKFNTRQDFVRGSSGAYMAAKRNKWLDTVCDHMDYLLRSDHDVVYLWNVPETDIYKIGVTSARLGHERIYEVSKKLGVNNPNILCYINTDEAVNIETSVLKNLTRKPDLGVFTGSTEFRIIPPSMLNSVVSSLENHHA